MFLEFFAPEGKLMTVLNRSAEILFINFLALICSLPIFTIGAATTAKYYVTMKIVRGKQIQLTKSYFKSFKDNFKQATILWLMCLVVGIFIALDILFVYSASEGLLQRVMLLVVIVAAAVYGLLLLMGWPLLARFTVTKRQWLHNSLTIAVLNLPNAFFGLILTVAPWILIYFFPQWALAWLAITIVSVYYVSSLCARILKKYEPEDYVDPDDIIEDSTADEPELKGIDM